VVRHADDGLLDFVPDELDFIFDLQTRLLHPLILDQPGDIPQPQLHRPGVSLLAVLAEIREQHRLPPIPLDGRRPLEILLAPTLHPPVQRVRPVVHGQVVAPAVEVGDLAAGDAVGDAADVLAGERVALGAVGLGRGKAQDDVLAGDLEFLDDPALVQEFEVVGERAVRHDCFFSELCCGIRMDASDY